MRHPVSTDELPLSDLIRFAAANRLTAALELRSQIAAGRISIRDGEVIDAVFGGLEGEAALHAALASRSLSVFRGRPPNASAARNIFASVPELLSSVIPRKSAPRASIGKLHLDVVERATSAVRGPKQPNEPSRPSHPIQRLGAMLLFGGVVVSVVATWSQWGQARDALRSVNAAAALGPATFVANSNRVRPMVAAELLSTDLPQCPIADCSHVVIPTLVLIDESGAAIGAKVDAAPAETQPAENAAIRYVLAARFRPAMQNGHAVTSWIELPVHFDSASRLADARSLH
jgi:hypothetical protein